MVCSHLFSESLIRNRVVARFVQFVLPTCFMAAIFDSELPTSHGVAVVSSLLWIEWDLDVLTSKWCSVILLVKVFCRGRKSSFY
jgi:hypothetical protein